MRDDARDADAVCYGCGGPFDGVPFVDVFTTEKGVRMRLCMPCHRDRLRAGKQASSAAQAAWDCERLTRHIDGDVS